MISLELIQLKYWFYKPACHYFLKPVKFRSQETGLAKCSVLKHLILKGFLLRGGPPPGATSAATRAGEGIGLSRPGPSLRLPPSILLPPSPPTGAKIGDVPVPKPFIRKWSLY